MAFGGILILVLHRRSRRGLTLATEPGTLAAAVAVAGNSDLPHLLDGKDTDAAMRAMLSDLNFGLDKVPFSTPSNFRNLLTISTRFVTQNTGQIRVAEAPHGYADVPQRL